MKKFIIFLVMPIFILSLAVGCTKPPSMSSLNSKSSTSSSEVVENQSQINSESIPTQSQLTSSLNKPATFEREAFLNFWNDAPISIYISEEVKNLEQIKQNSSSFWIIVSEYLQNSDKRNGKQINVTAEGIPYYPVELFEQTSLAMFGASIEYNNILDVGSEDGTICVATGYSPGYVKGCIIEDSITCYENIITAKVRLDWNEPGEATPRYLGTATYEFLWNSENKYCPYQLQSVCKE